MAHESRAVAFSARNLLAILRRWPLPNRYLLAYSGGLDSTALLYALSELKDQLGATLEAIHINHGLQGDANSWQAHCQAVCKSLDVKLISEQLDITAKRRNSPEALAREARYRAIGKHMASDDLLLTAHHQDDQAETLLLNLFRGAGVHGLAAVRPYKAWRQGFLGRPLLGWPRLALENYLQGNAVPWLEDPSNQDTRFSRNFLRQQVMPVITNRWPAAAQRLASSAGLCAQAADLLDQLADDDLGACSGEHPDTILLIRFGNLSVPRQSLTLRRWAQRNRLPLPTQAIVEQAALQLAAIKPESQSLLEWPGAEIRAAGELAYIMPTLPELPTKLCTSLKEFIQGGDCQCYGRLELQPAGQQTDAIDTAAWQVSSRSGGEQIKPAGDRFNRDLKYLFQSAAIPAWLRPYIPLLKRGDELLAVGDLWLEDDFSRLLADHGLVWCWTPGIALLNRFRDAIIRPRQEAG